MISLSYEQIESIVGSMQKNEANIADEYDTMSSVVKSLVTDGYMSAESANRYVEEFTALLAPDINTLLDMLEEFHTQLQKIAEMFKTVDETVAASLFQVIIIYLYCDR